MHLANAVCRFTDYARQKRKLDAAGGKGVEQAVDTSRPSAVFKPTAGRKHTLSIALPGSIVAK